MADWIHFLAVCSSLRCPLVPFSSSSWGGVRFVVTSRCKRCKSSFLCQAICSFGSSCSAVVSVKWSIYIVDWSISAVGWSISAVGWFISTVGWSISIVDWSISIVDWSNSTVGWSIL